MASIVQENGDGAGTRTPLRSRRLVFGRRTDCDIQHVFQELEKVSRQHAAIVEDLNQHFVVDLNSRNGTLLNGHKIKQRAVLNHGDVIQIGRIRFRFDAATERTSTSPLPSSKYELHFDDREPVGQIRASIDITDSQTTSKDHTGAPAERKLAGLIELLGSLETSIDSDDLLETVLQGLLRVFTAAERGFIALTNDQSTLEIIAIQVKTGQQDPVLRISRTIANQVMESKIAVLSSDVEADDVYSASQSLAVANVRSFMCAPLIDVNQNAMGVVQLETVDPRRPFSDQDLDVLSVVAPQISLALNFTKLHKEAIARFALDRDLQLAQQVQRGLLPSTVPEVTGYAFHHIYEPAFQVGGDYFDYIPLANDRFAVVLADVAGKGISASILMAKIAGELRLHLGNTQDGAEAVLRLNASMCADQIQGRFVTMVLAVIDTIRNSVELVNAGHMAPLLGRTDGTVVAVGMEKRNAAVGLMPRERFHVHTMQLRPGDRMIMFTDGFSEAENEAGEQYGEKALADQMSSPYSTLSNLGDRIVDQLRSFVGSKMQSDDMCLVGFSRLE